MQAAHTNTHLPAPEPTVIEDALFKCSVVFLQNYNYTHLNADGQEKPRCVVNQGGTWSGKTFSIDQLLYQLAVYRPQQLGRGVTITVVGETVPALKTGAYKDAEDIYHSSPFLKYHVTEWNKSDRVIRFRSGSKIEFKSFENLTQASSGKRDYLFVNEANSISWEIFWQLYIRTTFQAFIDYNPTVKFWAHDKLIDTEGVKTIISDHRHNTFISEEKHRQIEDIKNYDYSRWLVYGRGKTGNVIGLVYPNWQRIPDSKFPWAEFKERGYGGIDFGYTNDPTACDMMVVIGNSLFVHQIIHESGIPPKSIKPILAANGFEGKQRLYCEHDPDMINQLRRLGVMALPAQKGAGSINAGIMKLKEFNVFYTESSTNIHEEVTRYMWDKDPHTNQPINKPIDKWNHHMDAIRYGTYTHYFRTPN